jgi:hypothetical protein
MKTLFLTWHLFLGKTPDDIYWNSPPLIDGFTDKRRSIPIQWFHVFIPNPAHK